MYHKKIVKYDNKTITCQLMVNYTFAIHKVNKTARTSTIIDKAI